MLGGTGSQAGDAAAGGLTAWAAWRRLAEGWWEGRERLGTGSAEWRPASSAVLLELESWRCEVRRLRGPRLGSVPQKCSSPDTWSLERDSVPEAPDSDLHQPCTVRPGGQKLCGHLLPPLLMGACQRCSPCQ